MKGFLEQILQIALEGAYDEGSRFVKVKALSTALRVLNGVRRLLILQYVLIVSCFLCAMSTFATAFVLFQQYESVQAFFIEPKLIFCVSFLGISTLILYLTVRETAWIRAFKIDERIEAVSQESAFSQMVDVQALASMVESLIDKKLQKRFDSPPPTNEAPPSHPVKKHIKKAS